MIELAVDGGVPQRRKSFAPWPVFAPDELEAATRVLASGKVNYWTGEECKTFEQEFAAAIGRRYAIALANGTLALELALYALNIGPGDEVIVPSRTFIATASCVVMRGAKPVVADIDPVSGNLNANTVAAVHTKRTRAVIPVHMAGWPCNMGPLLAFANRERLHVIEDCAQAHGATYEGKSVGAFGTCAAFSFCQDKIMTTGGEGGMFLTDDESLWKRAWAYKDHGKSWDTVNCPPEAPGFRWLHESFGTNWRMTEMQAAIGRRQLDKLPDWLAVRRRNAGILMDGFSRIPGLWVPKPNAEINHAYYKFYVFLVPTALRAGWGQARIIKAINAEGIPCAAGSCSEIYREKAFVIAGLAPPSRMPIASGLSEISLMFTVHPTLGIEEMEDTVAAVAKVMKIASK